jgi:hypothetical protein
MERRLGPDHRRTLAARDNLARSYQSAGRTGDAIAIMERLVPDMERLLGPDHPDTLTARANLAIAKTVEKSPADLRNQALIALAAAHLTGTNHRLFQR